MKYGLGNRLNAFLAAVVVAHELRCELEIIWPPDNSDCFGSFAELFELASSDGIQVSDSAEEAWESAGRVPLKEMISRLGRGETLRLETYSPIGTGLLPKEEFSRRMRVQLRKLKPVAAVRALIATVPHPCVGLHIRLTDHLPCHIFTPRWCYRVALGEIIQSKPGVRILLCSDTPTFVTELKARWGTNLITPPEGALDPTNARSTIDGTRAALASLWLLSHCERIIAAPTSTFAKTAHQLGGGAFHELAVVSEVRRFKRMEIAWHLANLVRYDYGNQRWNGKAGLRGWKRVLAVWPAAATARFFASSLYQDRPLPWQQGHLRKRLRALLVSERAIAADPTVGLSEEPEETYQ